MEATLTSEHALYLYGIVAHPAPLPKTCDAVEDGTSIDLIAASGLACVVSSVLSRDYQSPGRTAAEQLAWVTPRAWRHHDVVRRLHAATTVIPLKFGTLCSSVDDVRALLTQHAESITALLERFAGKDEWTLTIRLDTNRIVEWFEQTDSTLTTLRAEEQSLPDGRAYFQRKKRQQRVANLLDAHIAAIAHGVYGRIAGFVEARSPENTQGSVAALLVDRAQFADLAGRLGELEGEQLTSGLSLELSGPWAPYSFVNGSVGDRELAPASGIDSRSRVH